MKKISLILIFIICFFIKVQAQGIIEISPLFEYPVAPENIESLEEKCNYLVKNFWNEFNFKKKEPIDQYALNEAFGVYVTPMRYASKKESEQSVDKLISKISGNQTLLLQFTKAAEENLYGPRADFWSDELYLKFLDALIKNKKISDSRKEKYIHQAYSLRESQKGNMAPSFEFIDKEGNKKNYFPMSTPTMLIFGNPDDTDWRLSRLKMDSNFNLSDALAKGKVNILYIVTAPIENWYSNISNYNSRWTLGSASDQNFIYDTRLNPSIYIIGADGKIINKFMAPEVAVNSILELVN